MYIEPITSNTWCTQRTTGAFITSSKFLYSQLSFPTGGQPGLRVDNPDRLAILRQFPARAAQDSSARAHLHHASGARCQTAVFYRRWSC